jgi:hypothetical protein
MDLDARINIEDSVPERIQKIGDHCLDMLDELEGFAIMVQQMLDELRKMEKAML